MNGNMATALLMLIPVVITRSFQVPACTWSIPGPFLLPTNHHSHRGYMVHLRQAVSKDSCTALFSAP